MAKHAQQNIEAEEYDWLNDPFDEKKIAEEQARVKKGSLKLGCAVVVILIAFIVLIGVGFMGMMDAMTA